MVQDRQVTTHPNTVAVAIATGEALVVVIRAWGWAVLGWLDSHL